MKNVSYVLFPGESGITDVNGISRGRFGFFDDGEFGAGHLFEEFLQVFGRLFLEPGGFFREDAKKLERRAKKR